MDTKLLRNFIAIVEQGSMTAAAKKLYVAQPALSNQLRVLEKELGARLLERTSRRQELTPAGQALYRQAKLMVSLENAVKQEVRDQRDGAAGTLRIALNPSTAITLLDGWLLEFAQCCPNVRYELYEVDSFEVVKLLESGVVDVGVA
ncbi:LysR family transcriptional regulator, partial [Akkermansia muciniphila]